MHPAGAQPSGLCKPARPWTHEDQSAAVPVAGGTGRGWHHVTLMCFGFTAQAGVNSFGEVWFDAPIHSRVPTAGDPPGRWSAFATPAGCQKQACRVVQSLLSEQ